MDSSFHQSPNSKRVAIFELIRKKDLGARLKSNQAGKTINSMLADRRAFAVRSSWERASLHHGVTDLHTCRKSIGHNASRFTLKIVDQPEFPDLFFRIKGYCGVHDIGKGFCIKSRSSNKSPVNIGLGKQVPGVIRFHGTTVLNADSLSRFLTK